MFRKVSVIIWDINGSQIYHSKGKTVLGVMLQVAAVLTVYRTVKLEITLN